MNIFSSFSIAVTALLAHKTRTLLASLGILIGIGLGATAVSIPVSVVSKHFPSSNRTIATGIVTAAGSFGYFISPLFTTYSLSKNGWENTMFIFLIFLIIGFFISQLFWILIFEIILPSSSYFSTRRYL